jgi:hypothetical protein
MNCKYTVSHVHHDDPAVNVYVTSYGGANTIDITTAKGFVRLTVEQFAFVVEHAQHLIGVARQPQRIVVVGSDEELTEILAGNKPTKPESSH